MNMVEGKIVHLLTGKNSLEEVSVNELKTIAERQPYFSVAQLLLAKKMKQENHPEYLQQVQKTALYFPNIHWLHHQLNKEEGEEKNESVISSQPDKEVEQKEIYSEPKNEITATPEADNVNKVEIAQPIIEEPIEVSVDREIFIPSQAQEPDAITEAVAENTTEVYDEEVIDPPGDVETDLPAESSSRLADIIEAQVKEFNKEVTPQSKLPIEPEPYHTVDYFASQGIKLNAQQLQQDQLGSRVRKFTDWLKQMKRVQSEPQDLGTDPDLENVVQGIAANSNEAREIVTEAMADVLVKQGKTEKAIQLYIKLSFLNPDKSAYFAGKIQELKGI